MRSLKRPWILAAVTLCLLLTQTRSMFAHAILMRSTPTKNAIVPGGEVDFSLHFNSRIDAPRSLLVLVLPGGKTAPLTVEKTDSLESLDAKASHLADGAYTLRWQVLANDGHISRGEIPFTVKNGK